MRAKSQTGKLASCGKGCVTNYGDKHGAIRAVWLSPADEGRGLVAWKGFKVAAVFCGHHANEGSHDIDNPARDAHRFAAGALVGRKTAEDLLTKRTKETG